MKTIDYNDCIHLMQRDEGYGPYERHDKFCALKDLWCPRCKGCSDFDDGSPEDEDEEDE